MFVSVKRLFRLVTVLVCTMILLAYPICSLAADEVETVQVPADATSSIPDSSEISDNPHYSEGTATSYDYPFMGVYAAGSSVSGGCSITKLSSTSVKISGHSITSPSDPGLKVTLKLQAYYDDAWHTLATTTKTESGTRVDLSKTYNVTSGYYYRVSATHALADGTSSTSQTNSFYVG